ncbi:phosphoribosylamine--glycine ligase [Candidatus Pelagibacter sp.]|nr:phosphoribosylamine--glycine ligase [Candidatus Pelagibacter sp.]
MNIGIIGSGGREHSLCFKLKESALVDKIFCFPGNAGTQLIAKNINLDITDFEKIHKTCEKEKIELIVVGPEKPLVDGIVDYFKDTKIKIFGPDKICSQLEGSKTFTKKLCKKYKIPTSDFKIIYEEKSAFNYLQTVDYPLVVKADGLAAGKGVYICKSHNDAKKAVKEIFDGRFGKADCVLIEQFLSGEEMSYFIVCDGSTYKFFQTAQDHKRVGENDTGKNTGGMGAYSPSRLYCNNLDEKINEKIIKPTLMGIKDLGTSYCGFLYIGLMIVDNEPFLIEFNVRMGDPECQTILPILESDLGELIQACCDKKLSSFNIKWKQKKSVCVVLCSNGYPDDYKKNIKIDKIKNIKLHQNEYIFHAGTKIENGEYFATGGRVLNIIATSENFRKSKDQTLKILNDINWKEGFFRKDIAYKVI